MAINNIIMHIILDYRETIIECQYLENIVIPIQLK